MIFASLQDRRGRNFLSIRDIFTHTSFRKKRMMTLMQLFLIHRYTSHTVHFVTPNENTKVQVERMKDLEIFSDVQSEIGQIIVAEVDGECGGIGQPGPQESAGDATEDARCGMRPGVPGRWWALTVFCAALALAGAHLNANSLRSPRCAATARPSIMLQRFVKLGLVDRISSEATSCAPGRLRWIERLTTNRSAGEFESLRAHHSKRKDEKV